MKGQYEVQKIIRDNVLAGLSAFGQNGWQCIEFAQSSKLNMDRFVAMNCIGTKQVGWVNSTQLASGIAKNDWLEEQTWQLHVVMKRDDSPVSADTVTTTDIASMLISWFNSEGNSKFRENGCANLRIDQSSILVYNDDSSIYQKRAVFTMKLQMPKEFRFGREEVDAVVPLVKPI